MQQRTFIDTNCFLHLRDLKDLPWREVFPKVTDLEIMVAPVVVDELDRLKTERGNRTRNRCRAALNLIERASAEEGMRIELRTEPFRISLVIAEAHRIDWVAFPRLDPSRADDHLIAAAMLEGTNDLPTLISFDTGPLIRARAMKLPAMRSPESWALPPQQDETEQKVARLERELAESRSTRPNLQALFIRDGERITLIQVRVLRPDPLPAAQQQKLADMWIKMNAKWRPPPPRATDVMYPLRVRATPREIRAYDEKYEAFWGGTQGHFAKLHDLVASACYPVEVAYQIHNASAVTALNMLINFGAPQGVVLESEGLRHERRIAGLLPPTAPEPPKEQSMLDAYRGFEAGINLPRSLTPGPRDPTGFYWQDRPAAASRHASLICQEFRAHEYFDDSYWLTPDGGLATDQIVVEISATNLPAPVRIEASLKVSEVAVKWTDPDLLALLPTWIADELK
jgi:hypothetical protein